MDAWGATLFEEEAAQNWLDEAYVSAGAGAVAQALDTAAERPVTDPLDRTEGAVALIAGEVVATAYGEMPAGLPQEVLDRLNAHGSEVRNLADAKRRARRALERVISDNSALHAHWAAAETHANWAASVNDLRRRLA